MSNTSTQHHVVVEAPRGQMIGVTAIVDGWPVLYVGEGSKASVRFRKYVADYSRHSDRPWKVGKRGYASLSNALRSLSIHSPE